MGRTHVLGYINVLITNAPFTTFMYMGCFLSEISIYISLINTATLAKAAWEEDADGSVTLNLQQYAMNIV